MRRLEVPATALLVLYRCPAKYGFVRCSTWWLYVRRVLISDVEFIHRHSPVTAAAAAPASPSVICHANVPDVQRRRQSSSQLDLLSQSYTLDTTLQWKSHISQGRVATRLRCGGIFSYHFIAYLSLRILKIG